MDRRKIAIHCRESPELRRVSRRWSGVDHRVDQHPPPPI
ncbi:hypothetical protein A2U01_0064835 [Trifolium medium]|uniref:Uncharacterized protein n=1 Tax=Trifolium medium TaxID=97028 RepID=A0A392S434_9FABA|nr:hypothetical protein [Trifolium medium]